MEDVASIIDQCLSIELNTKDSDRLKINLLRSLGRKWKLADLSFLLKKYRDKFPKKVIIRGNLLDWEFITYHKFGSYFFSVITFSYETKIIILKKEKNIKRKLFRYCNREDCNYEEISIDIEDVIEVQEFLKSILLEIKSFSKLELDKSMKEKNKIIDMMEAIEDLEV